MERVFLSRRLHWTAFLAGCLLLLCSPCVSAQSDEKLRQAFDRHFEARQWLEATAAAKRYLKVVETRHPPGAPALLKPLALLSAALLMHGRYLDAEPVYKRRLAIIEAQHPRGSAEVSEALVSFAFLYSQMKRYGEAERLQRRRLADFEFVHGADHPDLVPILHDTAELARDDKRLDDARTLYLRALAIVERTHGLEHSAVAKALEPLVAIAEPAMAVDLQQRVVNILQRVHGHNHDTVNSATDQLVKKMVEHALELYGQDRFADAERIYRRILSVLEGSTPRLQTDWFGLAKQSLAEVLEKLGRGPEVEALFQEVVALLTGSDRSEHQYILSDVHGHLGRLRLEQGRVADAESHLRRRLEVLDAATEKDAERALKALVALMDFYRQQSRPAELQVLQRREAAIRQSARDVRGGFKEGGAEKLKRQLRGMITLYEEYFGADAQALISSTALLAGLHTAHEEWQEAVTEWRRVTEAMQRRSRLGETALEGGHTGKRADEIERSNTASRGLVKTLASLDGDPPQREAHAREAFMVAQAATASTVATALARAAARSAAGDSKLGVMVRERQDLATEWQAVDDEWTRLLGSTPANRDRVAEAALHARIAAIEARLKEIDARVAMNFPNYAALANPKPAGIAELQAALGDDEALVLLLDTVEVMPLPEETFIWVVTKTDMRWRRSDLGVTALTRKVASLRRALDLTAGGVRAALPVAATSADFDFAVAYELYASLLAPVESLIRDKRHLIVVPSGGPLTALPFHVLLTAPPSAPAKATDRDIPWLARRHAITTLPAVSSLPVLRLQSQQARASKPFVAFADPVFKAGASSAPIKTASTRGFGDFFRGVNADSAALSSLRPLPDTADEVRAVAQVLGGDARLLLGRDAREAQVKRLPLNQYRVVHFATHGLVAGEIKNLAEPALALSAPKTPTPDDDGLLTASEVASLKLNADWVILSACNTAAGDRPGAEALSGLARAFFYAGTKALLVSHWPVKSSAAVKLTTGTFEALRRAPGIGRSEALRRSMIAMIEAGGADAHPSSWAPFVVVGEGGAAR